MFDVLDKNNFLMYAMRMYDNPSCTSVDEFHEDLNRIKYVKRLLGKFEAKGLLRERLILNHIIILGNVFGLEATCRILFYKIEEKYHSSLKTFLHYLQYLPRTLNDLDLNKIPLDHKIMKALEEL
tara:strand:+ start:18758 stop:19132 length:375 start_codon:yes stop_codon:yes gene_type:complete